MNLSSFISELKSPSTQRSRRFRWLALVLVVYSITGFFVVPAIVKAQLLKRLPGLTHRQAAVKRVKVNPYALSLTVRGLELTETNGAAFAGFDEFHANFQLSSLFHRAWTFRKIRLVRPTANIARNAGGHFNFANLHANRPAPSAGDSSEPKSLPAVLVQHLVVANGKFSFTDHTRPVPIKIDYGPVDLDLKQFTTRRNRDGQYSLAVNTRAGGSFAWSGTLRVNPPQSAGKFTLRGAVLKTYSPYLADFFRAEIADGVLDVGADYRLDAGVSPLELEVTNAAVKLARLQLEELDPRVPLLALDNVSVRGASARLASREARVPIVSVRGGSLVVRRDSDGRLNWLKGLVNPINAAAPASAAGEPPAPAAPWKARLDEFDLRAFSVRIQDHVPATPAQLGLNDLRVNVKGVSNQSNAPVKATVEFNWPGGGTVRVDADGTLEPAAAKANLAASRLALAPLQPYVEQYARLVLNSGDLTLQGKARYAPADSQQPLVEFTGDLAIGSFASMETVAYQDFARWTDLSARGIRLTLQTNALRVDEVKFTGLETSVVVSTNGQLAIQALLKASAPAAAGSAAEITESIQAPPTLSEPFPVHIAAIVFDKCSFLAVDQSITPPFNTRLEEFNGTIRDLTLPGLVKAGVDIRGTVSALAPFEISGAILPDRTNPFVDLRLTMKNNDLTPFTSYTEKFAGYPLNKGRLSFDMSCQIDHRLLRAENAVVIDQFTFGQRNDSPHATRLPVKLAVALLKDREGRIDLNLPVSGSLDDPQFSIAGLVWNSVINILARAAASPFALLGAAFGGGEELQYVDFAPGSVAIDPVQTNKLDRLAIALHDRPGLNLEISAILCPADLEAAARQQLHGRMLLLRQKERAGRKAALQEPSQLDPADYARLLRRSYRDAFGTGPERALREAGQAAAATNQLAASASAPSVTAVAEAEGYRGATLLMQRTSKGAIARPVDAAPPGSAVAPGIVPAQPMTEDEFVLEEMERRLAAAAPVSENYLRELLRERSEAVQKLLLGTGKVAAERIFILAPKSMDPGTNGVGRAVFSLN